MHLSCVKMCQIWTYLDVPNCQLTFFQILNTIISFSNSCYCCTSCQHHTCTHSTSSKWAASTCSWGETSEEQGRIGKRGETKSRTWSKGKCQDFWQITFLCDWMIWYDSCTASKPKARKERSMILICVPIMKRYKSVWLCNGMGYRRTWATIKLIQLFRPHINTPITVMHP